MKRFTATVLCIAIIATLFTVPVSAENKTYTYTYTQATSSEKKDSPDQLPPQPEPDDSGEYFTFRVTNAISDDMILQRDEVIRIWGTSDYCDNYIYGTLLGETRYAKVQDDGTWCIEFSPKSYTTTPTTVTIFNKAGVKQTFSRILIGDVWIVAGQSNAEFTFKDMESYYGGTVSGLVNEDDNIRLYYQGKGDMYSAPHGQFPRTFPINPLYRWKKTTLSEVRRFSALGYIFCKRLYEETGIPQGMVAAAVGGARLNEFYTDAVKEAVPYCLSNHVAAWFAYGEDQVIYNLYMNPFKHMSICGILFYQGESDNEWSDEYAGFLTKCVEGWREEFDSDFDFYNVQLTSHAMCTGSFPYLPQVRAEQVDAYYNIPDSYLITSIDAGWKPNRNEDYAHPFDKITPGTRAANVALAEYYHKDGYDLNNLGASLPEKMTWSANSILIDFTNVGSGLKTTGGELKGFAIRYIDDTTLDAKAEIVDKDTVKVSFPSSNKKAIAVEYAMIHDAMQTNCNLINSERVACPSIRLYNKENMREDDFYGSLFLDANYTKSSIKDFTGNSKTKDYGTLGTGITFIDDATVGQKVAHFENGGVSYTIDDVKTKNNFTLETYVKVYDSTWGLICGTYYKDDDCDNYKPFPTEYGFGLQFGKSLTYGNGLENNLSVLETCGYNGDYKLTGGKIRSKWVHVVFVNDGETGKLYVNGELKSESPLLAHAYHNYTKSNIGDFRVGGYALWNASNYTTMDCAFVRLFNAPASEDQVKTLYDARNTGYLPDESEVLRGDVNLDGKITSIDYLSLRLYFKGSFEFTSNRQKLAADANADGSITSTDYIKIKRMFVGL